MEQEKCNNYIEECGEVCGGLLDVGEGEYCRVSCKECLKISHKEEK